ncbi:hypothetical protein GUJ93_ZPchr0001g32392 [Zizania palustris]|uniref:RCK N-terminal domain-containing protein n=1 Tax=Zizania palustris TaxID=103762 RepID=A0A8J5VP48_ZIZPA|nr:hypothetical protein GUJ93_ZPchr0001g32392 [Zizania palustris]
MPPACLLRPSFPPGSQVLPKWSKLCHNTTEVFDASARDEVAAIEDDANRGAGADLGYGSGGWEGPDSILVRRSSRAPLSPAAAPAHRRLTVAVDDPPYAAPNGGVLDRDNGGYPSFLGPHASLPRSQQQTPTAADRQNPTSSPPSTVSVSQRDEAKILASLVKRPMLVVTVTSFSLAIWQWMKATILQEKIRSCCDVNAVDLFLFKYLISFDGGAQIPQGFRNHADRLAWGPRIVSVSISSGGMLVFATMLGLVSDAISEKVDSWRKGKSEVIEVNHILILGWSDKLGSLLKQLAIANKSIGGGVVVVLAERDKEEMEMDIGKLEFDFMGTSVICRSGSPLLLADLKKVSVSKARAIIVLASDENADQIWEDILGFENAEVVFLFKHFFWEMNVSAAVQVLEAFLAEDESVEDSIVHSDSRSLATLLLIRDIQSRRLPSKELKSPLRYNGFCHSSWIREMQHASDKSIIISEILDSRTRNLVSVSKISDYVLSNELVSMALAMVAEDKQINRVLEELFAEEGNEMCIRSAEFTSMSKRN